MRTMLLAAVTALLLTYSAAAEEPADKGTRTAEQTVEGCLSKSGTTYVIVGATSPNNTASLAETIHP